MAKLRLQNNNLIVEGDKTESIFEWNHRLFFTVANEYKLDKSNNRYLFADPKQLSNTLKETISYLQEEGLEFEVDEAVTKLLQKFQIDQKEYEEAIHSSLEIQQHLGQEISAPKGLVRSLKSYQQQGLKHLLSVKHGANFSVPGSGKTTVVYAAFERLRQDGIVNKLLVIGPRSCFFPWEEEALACFGRHISSCRLTGSKMARQSLYLQSEEYDLFLCTYHTAVKDINELIGLCKRYKLFVVIDESHNIKKLEGGVWSEVMLEIAPYATRRAILSGTPMPNDYTDLWTQITFLWPGKQVLGDRIPYRYRCDDKTEQASIRRAIRPFFFRVTKAKLDLPSPQFNIQECDLKPYQVAIYRALAVKFLQEMNIKPEEREVLRQWRKAKMVRLIQAASNPTLLAQYSEEFDVPPLSGEGVSIIQLIDTYPQYETPAKIELAVQLVRNLTAQGEKVVVWTSFIHNIRMLENLLHDLKPFIVYGAIPRDESEDIEFNREQQIREFKTVKQPAILLANPAACAESISLHKVCHHAVYLDRTFNCGQYMQSLDRIHRIGLAPNEIVTYHLLIAKNTIDETINRRLKEKQEKMYRLLEDDLPEGNFEVEDYRMEEIEREEVIDFEETISDLKQQFSFNIMSN